MIDVDDAISSITKLVNEINARRPDWYDWEEPNWRTQFGIRNFRPPAETRVLPAIAWADPARRDNYYKKLLDSDPVRAACEFAVYKLGLLLAEQGGRKLLETVCDAVLDRIEDDICLVVIWFNLLGLAGKSIGPRDRRRNADP